MTELQLMVGLLQREGLPCIQEFSRHIIMTHSGGHINPNVIGGVWVEGKLFVDFWTLVEYIQHKGLRQL